MFSILALSDIYNLEGYGRLDSFMSTVKSPYISTLSGDFIGPSKYSVLDYGKPLIDAISMINIDYLSLGNHEFDIPLDKLSSHLSNLNLVSSNIILENTIPYTIREISGLKIGIVGICTSNFWSTYRFQVEFSNISLPKVDYLIALTHQDLEEDMLLIDSYPQIDLILGGHIHTPSHHIHKGVSIIRTGENLERIAKIDIGFNIDVSFIELKGYAISKRIQKHIVKTDLQLKAISDRIIFDLNSPLDTFNMREKPNTFATFICDYLIENLKVDYCLLNGGLFRYYGYYSSNITLGDIMSIFPMNNPLIITSLTGKDINEAISYSRNTKKERYGGYLHSSSNILKSEHYVYSVIINGPLLFGMDSNPILSRVNTFGFNIDDGVPIHSLLI